MKIINRDNIEECLFDFFEGNLNPEEKLQVTDFLNNHPEYQADYDAWKKSYVVEPPMTYMNADKLVMKGGFGKKGLWVFGTVTVGIIATILWMFGKPGVDKDLAVATHLIQDSTPIENKITSQQSSPLAIAKALDIDSSNSAQPDAYAYNQSVPDNQKINEEASVKYSVPAKDKESPTLQPIKNPKKLPKEKPKAEAIKTPETIIVPAVAEDSKPATTVVAEEKPRNESNDSTRTTTIQPEATIIDSANIKEAKKKGKSKWVIKVIPIENSGL